MLATQNGNCNYGNESLLEVVSKEDLLVYKMNIQKKNYSSHQRFAPLSKGKAVKLAFCKEIMVLLLLLFRLFFF